MSTQVNERQLLNPTPQARMARPSREDSPELIDTDHKAVDTRHVTQLLGIFPLVNKFKAELMELLHFFVSQSKNNKGLSSVAWVAK